MYGFFGRRDERGGSEGPPLSSNVAVSLTRKEIPAAVAIARLVSTDTRCLRNSTSAFPSAIGSRPSAA